jgi:hypothetical protein
MLSEQEKKERRRETNRKYNENNKEKINERKRIYYQNNKEKEKERVRVYNENNKEKVKERTRVYNENYYQNNKEKEKERMRAYSKTERGIKSNRINKWKHKGVICENFDNLYDYYINCKDCEECGIELTVDRYNTETTRCLDHCHETGEFRNVLCNFCNIKRK